MAITKKVSFSHRLNFMRCSELPPPATAILVATDNNGLFYWIRDPQYLDGVFDDEPPHKLVTVHGEPYKPVLPKWMVSPLTLYQSGQLRGAIDHWRTWKDVPALRRRESRRQRFKRWGRKLWRNVR